MSTITTISFEQAWQLWQEGKKAYPKIWGEETISDYSLEQRADYFNRVTQLGFEDLQQARQEFERIISQGIQNPVDQTVLRPDQIEQFLKDTERLKKSDEARREQTTKTREEINARVKAVQEKGRVSKLAVPVRPGGGGTVEIKTPPTPPQRPPGQVRQEIEVEEVNPNKEKPVGETILEEGKTVFLPQPHRLSVQSRQRLQQIRSSIQETKTSQEDFVKKWTQEYNASLAVINQKPVPPEVVESSLNHLYTQVRLLPPEIPEQISLPTIDSLGVKHILTVIATPEIAETFTTLPPQPKELGTIKLSDAIPVDTPLTFVVLGRAAEQAKKDGKHEISKALTLRRHGIVDSTSKERLRFKLRERGIELNDKMLEKHLASANMYSYLFRDITTAINSPKMTTMEAQALLQGPEPPEGPRIVGVGAFFTGLKFFRLTNVGAAAWQTVDRVVGVGLQKVTGLAAEKLAQAGVQIGVETAAAGATGVAAEGVAIAGGTIVGQAVGLVAGLVLAAIIAVAKWVKRNWHKVKKFIKGIGWGTLGVGVLVGSPLLIVPGGIMVGATILAGGGITAGLSAAAGSILFGLGWLFKNIFDDVAKPLIISFISMVVLTAFCILIITNSAYIVPDGPEVGGGSRGDDVVAVSCFKPEGPWAAENWTQVETAVNFLIEKHPLYINKVCSAGDIMVRYQDLNADDTPDEPNSSKVHGLYHNAKIFPDGFARITLFGVLFSYHDYTTVVFTLTHETGHHMNHVFPLLYADFIDSVKCQPGNPDDIPRQTCDPVYLDTYRFGQSDTEDFAENMAWYVMYSDNINRQTYNYFKDNNLFLQHYIFADTKVFEEFRRENG